MKLSVTINSLKGALTFTDAESRTTVSVPARGSKTFVCEWEVWNRMSSIVDVNRDNDNCTYTVATYPAANAGSASQDTARINALRVDVSALQAYVTTPFDDYAARKAAIDFNERNLETLYSQTDDGTLWRLVQITPCIKWVQVAGVRTTYENLTLYVNGATGNDTTGDGSVTYPFKTLHCLDDFDDRKLKHEIKFIVTAGTYTYFPATPFINHERYGKIVLDGTDNTWPKYKGPFTVSAVADASDPGPMGVALAIDLTVTAAGWTVDEFFKKSVHVLTGAQAGSVFPVFKNTTDTIRLSPDWIGFEEGDTFEIVTEPVVVETATPTIITGKRSGLFEDNSFWMAGIRFVSDAGPDPVMFRSIGVVLCASSFIDKYDDESRWSCGVWFHECDVNVTAGQPGIFKDALFAKDSYIHPFQSQSDFDEAEEQWNDICSADTNLYYLCCRRAVNTTGGEYSIYAEILCSGFYAWGCKYAVVDYLYIDQIGFDQEAMMINTGCLEIWSAYVNKSQRVLKVCPGSMARIDWMKNPPNSTTENYACVMGAASTLVVRSATDVTAAGRTGAINFRAGNKSPHVAWPNDTTQYSDGSGAWATYDTNPI